MHSRTLSIVSASILFGVCITLTAGSRSSAQTTEKPAPPNGVLELRLVLQKEKSGQSSLRVDMPVNEEVLRQLVNGQEKQPTVFLSAGKDVPYGEVVKVIDMLESLGMHKLSLNTKSE